MNFEKLNNAEYMSDDGNYYITYNDNINNGVTGYRAFFKNHYWTPCETVDIMEHGFRQTIPQAYPSMGNAKKACEDHLRQKEKRAIKESKELTFRKFGDGIWLSDDDCYSIQQRGEEFFVICSKNNLTVSATGCKTLKDAIKVAKKNKK